MKLPACATASAGRSKSRHQPQGSRRPSGRSQAADQRRLVFRVGASRRIPNAASLAIALHQGRGRRPSAF